MSHDNESWVTAHGVIADVTWGTALLAAIVGFTTIRRQPSRSRCGRGWAVRPCLVADRHRTPDRGQEQAQPGRRTRAARHAGLRAEHLARGPHRAGSPLRSADRPLLRSRAGAAVVVLAARPLASRETVDERLTERLEVVGLAAGNQRLGPSVHTRTSSSTQGPPAFWMSVCEARPAGERAVADDVGFDERPRTVADHCDRLAGCRRSRARTRPPSASVRSRSGLATPPGSTSASYVVARRVRDRVVDGEGVGLVEVVERLHLARLRATTRRGVPPASFDRLPRFGQLDLLDALVRDQERDASCRSMCWWPCHEPCRSSTPENSPQGHAAGTCVVREV